MGSDRIIYVSGPITGMPDGNVAAFAEATRTLRDMGFIVRNPVELCADIAEGSSWEEYMRRCIVALCECTEIVMIKGWMHSRGANVELMTAYALGLEVHYGMGYFELRSFAPGGMTFEPRAEWLIPDKINDAARAFAKSESHIIKLTQRLSGVKNIADMDVAHLNAIGKLSEESAEAIRKAMHLTMNLRLDPLLYERIDVFRDKMREMELSQNSAIDLRAFAKLAGGLGTAQPGPWCYRAWCWVVRKWDWLTHPEGRLN